MGHDFGRTAIGPDSGPAVAGGFGQGRGDVQGFREVDEELTDALPVSALGVAGLAGGDDGRVDEGAKREGEVGGEGGRKGLVITVGDWG